MFMKDKGSSKKITLPVKIIYTISKLIIKKILWNRFKQIQYIYKILLFEKAIYTSSCA